MRLHKISYKENYPIMLGHMADDLCQGATPAILAFMYQEGRLESYAQVAFLIMATTIVNAIAQPLTGYLADRKPRPYIMTVGMLTAAVGIMFLGLTENYSVMIMLIAINGLGVSIFHPAAGKLANIFAKDRAGKGMSIFSVGGNIGYAVGPVYFTFFYMFLGLHATLLIIVPGLCMSVYFMLSNRKYVIFTKRNERLQKKKRASGENKENYYGMTILLLLIFARSAGIFSLTTFLPLYFMHNLGVKEELSTLSLTIVALSGAIATFFGGPAADRFGFTQVVRITSFLAVPFAFMFVLTDNIYLATAILIPTAVFYYSGMSPTVVIGQRFLCNHVGMATGITVGLGISFGGLVSPLIGKIGDNYGLESSMLTIASLFGLAALISLLLPVINKAKVKKA